MKLPTPFLPTDLPGLVRQLTGLWRNLTIALSNIDNTSDASKPISTATQTALNLKAPLIAPALVGGTVDGQPIGYKNIPFVGSAAATYTFAATDAGKVYAKTGTGVASLTCNASVFAAGDVLYVINNATAGAVTIVQGAGVTMRLTGTATTGSRTLAPLGRAMIYWPNNAACYVDGPGVT